MKILYVILIVLICVSLSTLVTAQGNNKDTQIKTLRAENDRQYKQIVTMRKMATDQMQYDLTLLRMCENDLDRYKKALNQLQSSIQKQQVMPVAPEKAAPVELNTAPGEENADGAN